MKQALAELVLDLGSLALVTSGAYCLAFSLFPHDALRAVIATVLISAAVVGLARSAKIDVRRLVPAAMALWLMPWASDREPLVWLVATLAIGLMRLAAPEGRVFVASGPPSWRDPYSLALLSAVIAFAAHHVVVGAEQTSNFDNDAAYYYAVGRHIAETGRLEEPLVWHFLVPQAHVVHPAFDYWQGMTALVLVVPFRVFGVSHAVAATTSAVISGLVLIVVWALVTQTRLVQHRLVQLAILIVCAFTPALSRYRVDTETAILVQLWVTLALLALVKRRPTLVVLAAFPLLWTRADGALTVSIFGLAALAIARTPRERRNVVAMGVALGALTIAFYEVHFGTLTPPGAAVATRLPEYFDLYRAHAERRTLAQTWTAHLAPGVFDAAVVIVQYTFTAEPLVALTKHLLVFFALAATRLSVERRTSRAVALRVILVLAMILPFVLAWSSPIVYSAWRTLHGLVPAMALMIGIGLEVALTLTRRPSSFAAGLLEAIVLAAVFMQLATVSKLRPDRDELMFGRTRELQAMAGELGSSVVLTTSPWWVAAETNARAVSLPMEDEASIEQCIERYEVQWVVIGPADGWVGGAAERMQPGPLGRLVLEPDEHRGYYRVMRVRRPAP